MHKKNTLTLLFVALFLGMFSSCTQASDATSAPTQSQTSSLPSDSSDIRHTQNSSSQSDSNTQAPYFFSVQCKPIPNSEEPADIPAIDFNMMLPALCSAEPTTEGYRLNMIVASNYPVSMEQSGWISGSYEVESAADPFVDVFIQDENTVYISQQNISPYPVLLKIQQQDSVNPYAYHYYIYGEDGLVEVVLWAKKNTPNQIDYFNAVIATFELV